MALALHAASADHTPEPRTTGEYRLGDVRHVFAGVQLAEQQLGFRAREPFDAGMAELARAALRPPPA
jgi:dTDP-L-rhamnose 4-epimerase